MGDRYTITDRIDSGGMAEVFRGVAHSLQGFKKNVAIKRILPNLSANAKFINMFLDEAKLSLYLQHANIVQVFDIGQSDETYFLVMEFVNGCNLKALLERLRQRNVPIEIAHAIYLMLEACKALNYAHHLESPETGAPLGIVHRDISPPNILISKMGEVKLVDFGLAKANSQIESTDPGVVKGKFSYLSPEAASGRGVDARADIFAVGILLWEMFTSRRLFYGETDYQTVELVRQARVPSIAAINPDIEPELEQIVRKALARDPDQRYQHAADLGDALAQYLFSRRMKVTARDIATLVKDVQKEATRQRKTAKESIINRLIKDEVAKVTSLVDGDSPLALPDGPAGSESLDPASFIDTSAWAEDFGFQSQPPEYQSEPPAAVIHSQPSQRPSRPPTVTVAEEPVVTPEVESLQQMLEPDRTGVHAQPANKSVWIAIAVLIVLLALIGGTLILFKDRLFGQDTLRPVDDTVAVVIDESQL